MEARLRVLIERLAARGLDLAAPLATADYDAEVAPALRLPSFGRGRALAVVVGNTRALWPFVRGAAGADPVDTYVVRAIEEALDGARAEVRWAHHVPATVAVQRAAAIAGLAWLSPSHLCVHPVYGPWIALRAVIVLDADGPPARAAPVAPPCDCARGCAAAYEAAIAAGVPRDGGELRAVWRRWLAVRDGCPVGRAHRYDDDQISHHYTYRAAHPFT